MSIDFNEQTNSNFNSGSGSIIKVVVVILLIAVGVFVFLNREETTSGTNITQQIYPPIEIDFNFLTSDFVNSLEFFSGIPSLSGFIDVYLENEEPEGIATGRDNPFKQVTDEEIETKIQEYEDSQQSEEEQQETPPGPEPESEEETIGPEEQLPEQQPEEKQNFFETRKW